MADETKSTGGDTFGMRLAEAREARGWSRSDLARAIWGESADARGYSSARNRDLVRKYELDLTAPSPKNALALARALDKDVSELFPTPPPSYSLAGENGGIGVSKRGDIVQMQVLDLAAGQVHLKVDVVTDIALAAEIVKKISDHGPSTIASPSGEPEPSSEAPTAEETKDAE